MRKIKSYLARYPEYYLLIVTLLACYTPPFSINALGVAVTLVFASQIIFKLRATGLLLGSLFFLFNLYLVFALVDELAEFSEISRSAIQLGLVGALVIGVNLTMSALMVVRYLP